MKTKLIKKLIALMSAAVMATSFAAVPVLAKKEVESFGKDISIQQLQQQQ